MNEDEGTAVPRHGWLNVALYATTVFLSACLLFMVQFMVAKAILPWFGGSADVWTTCMLFFQVALLLGYLYADRMVHLRSPRTLTVVHSLLLAASLLVLPVLPGAGWKPHGPGNPQLRILWLLTGTVGIPFVLLSTTSSLLQARFNATRKSASVYRLYALSNFGSMVGLVAYPFLVETTLTLRGQDLLWSGAYAVFACLCAAVLWLSLRELPADLRASASPRRDLSPPPGKGRILLWVLLAWCPSTLLLAVTNHISQNLAAIPFFWMVPLALYLFSFIVCFSSRRFYPRTLCLVLVLPSLAALIWSLDHLMSFTQLLAILWGGLFTCCLVCHGELARLKPAPDRLTGFYLAVSCGGAAGGLLAGLIAPAILPGYFELHLALVAWPALTATAVLVGWKSRPLSSRIRAWVVIASLAVTLTTAGFLAASIVRTLRSSWMLARNFYGSLRLVDSNLNDPAIARREFIHAGINHGLQFFHPLRRREPTSYFGLTSGIGLLLRSHHFERPRRVGILGLGTGTLATYGRPGDTFRFYEINPLVIKLARNDYTYLSDSRARVEIVEGDGRLALESEPPQGFDILVMDAFAGDAVPVHLLTREAFRLYARHLAPDGVLAVNVTNGYLELAPVVLLSARNVGREAVVVTDYSDIAKAIFRSDWVLVSERAALLGAPLLQGRWKPIHLKAGFVPWTDSYSNLLEVLR